LNYFRFLRSLIIFTALLSLAAGVLSFTLPEKYFAPQVWMILIYFLVVSALLQLVLMRSANDDGKKFVRAFMAGTTIKLFIHIIAVIIFTLTNREQAIPIIFTFFCCYLSFTVFEVTMQLKKPEVKENQ
jgi:L-asparagine transporter-like permease